VNDAACRSSGYSKKEFLKMKMFDIDPVFTRKRWSDSWERVCKEKSVVIESFHKTKKGRIFPVEIGVNYLNFEGKEYHFTFVRDITERKKVEEALRTREAYLTSIIDNQSGMVWLKDRDSKLLAVNQVYIKMAGRKKPEEVVGKTDLDFWPTEMANKFREDDRKVMKSRKPIVVEERISKKGVLRWLETFKTPVFDVNGKVIGITGYARDITERKKFDEALLLSNQRMALHVQKTPLAVIEWDENFKVREWNPAAERMFGYSRKEAVGKCYDFIVPESARPKVDIVGKNLMAQKGGQRSTNENITKKGSIIVCEWFNTTLINPDGKTMGVTSLVEDVTARDRAQKALRESEFWLKESQKVSHIGSYEFDVRSGLWKCSDALQEIFGIGPNYKKNIQGWGRILHPANRKDMLDYLQREFVLHHKAFNREYRISRPSDGKTRWVLGRGSLVFDADGVPVKMIGTIQDITERKELEQALEKRILSLTQPESEGENVVFEDLFNLQELQMIQDEFTKATGVASIITRPDGTPITRPSNFCSLCSDVIRKTEKGLVNCYRSDACIGRNHPAGPVVQPCLSGGLWDAGAGINVGGRHVANWLIGQVRDEAQSEEKIRTYAREIGADEKKIVEAYRKVPTMSREQFDKVAQLLFTMSKQLSQFAYQNLQQARAITEGKRAEELIRAGRHQLLQVIDAVPHMIFAKDKDGRFLLVNRAVAQAYQRDPKSLIGVRRQDIHGNREEVESFLAVDREVLATGKPRIVSDEVFTDAQGTRHILQTFKIPFDMVGISETCILGVSVDVTEQKRIEEFRNDIVRTVSHELRTPLSIEKEGISLLMDEMVGPVNPEQKEILQTVMRSIDRLARMISNLLDISSIETGKIKLLKKMTDLRDLVKDVAFEFKKRAEERGIPLSVKLPEGAVKIVLDPDKITQVLSNLVDNALKFTEKGSVEISVMLRGDEVECIVRDTGVGITPENVKKLFEKFQQFSRKAGPGEKGFGLGLSIAKGIIELHRGRIWAQSNPGQGTSITFALPLEPPLETA
jgi:PAS domain S-box-containing protein